MWTSGMEMFYDPWSERPILFNARDEEGSELWWLDATGWRHIEILGNHPGFRVRPAIGVLPTYRALVLFGRSAFGDVHVDAADPDCD
jgi:hypothetical protein